MQSNLESYKRTSKPPQITSKVWKKKWKQLPNVEIKMKDTLYGGLAGWCYGRGLKIRKTMFITGQELILGSRLPFECSQEIKMLESKYEDFMNGKKRK